MCQGLAELRSATQSFAERFDPALLSSGDLRTARDAAAAMEAVAATVKALAAARLAGASAKRTGHRSAAHELARATGTSVSAAREVLDTGRRLGDQPQVAAAARRGELSAAQVSMIADATAADPGAEGDLVTSAGTDSMAELKERAARVKASADPDLEARRERIRSGRRLRAWTDVEGVWRLRAEGNPEEGAQVMAALAPMADQYFHAARREGRREHPEAYAFDALVRMATESSCGPSSDGSKVKTRVAPTQLLLRVDYDAFLRGMPTAGETCELVGYGPVAVSVVRDLLETADPFVSAILTRAQAVVGVAHVGRRPNAYQQSALRWLYPCCAAAGCADQISLEIDHREEWSKIHYTAFDLLDRLCRFHHRLKTTEGWALVEGSGKRAFVPPEDPRHPRQRGRSP
jgi:hypothetical protein